jgi:hypothetical protein
MGCGFKYCLDGSGDFCKPNSGSFEKNTGSQMGHTNKKDYTMGGFQRAGTGKNKKVTEISPLLAFWPEGLGIKFL